MGHKLRWTTELPTKAGVYWQRQLGKSGKYKIYFLYINPGTDVAGGIDLSGDRRRGAINLNDGEWAGPLEPPI